MTRSLPLVVVATLALAGPLAVTASSSSTVTSTHSKTYGSLLSGSTGRTLYHLTTETHGAIKCTAACATLWPPVLVTGAQPTAGEGVTAAKLGTIKRPDGRSQVTYNGLPLYRYSGDHKAGDVNGEGVGGDWYAVGPAGKIVKAALQAPATTTTAPASGGYGGY